MYTEVAMQAPVREWKTVSGEIDYGSIKPDGNGFLDRMFVRIGKWCLKRGGAFSSVTKYETTGIQLLGIDPNNVIKTVLDSDRAIQMVWNKQCSVIACGPDEYDHWTQGMLADTPLSQFTGGAHLGKNGHTRIVGLRVVVVPWMTGAVLLPKEVFGE